MNKKNAAKLISIPMLAVFLGTTLPYHTYGEDLNSQLQSVQNKMEAQQSKKAEAEAQVRTFSERLKVVQDSLNAATAELNAIQQKRKNIESEIAKNEEELKKAQKRYEERMKVLEKRCRNIYENGQLNYLDVLLGAENFNDFATRVELFKRIIQSDLKLIREIKAEKENINRRQEELKKQREEILVLEKEAKAKQAVIEERRQEQAGLLYQAEHDRDVALEAIRELEESSNAIKAKIRAIESQRSSGGSSGAAEEEVRRGTGRFIWPVNGPITSPFGYRNHPIFGRQILHSGIDIGVPTGTVVHAADSGTVILSGWVSGYGYTVIIEHGNGFSTLYAHNSELLVSAGQSVSQGQPIAYAGSTGNSTGPHCHFEVRVHGEPQDPMGYL